MELVQAQVNVSKDAYLLGVALGKIAMAAKDALKDGASAADIAPMLAVLMSADVSAGLAGISKLGADMAENKMAFVSAFVVAAVKIAEDMAPMAQAAP